MLQEIEYYNKLQLNHHKVYCSDSLKMLSTAFGGSDMQHQPTFLKSLSNIVHKPRQVASVTNPKKKRRTSKLMMPSMCSMVEVAECNPPAAISRFTYMNLKADV